MLKRGLAGVLAALALSACGGQLPGTPTTGTVTGHVQLRVCGGAAISDQPPCRVSPADGTLLTFDALQPGADANKHTAVTNAAGAYSIALAPGTYTISIGAARTVPGPAQTQLAGSAPSPRSSAGPRQVTVVAGKTVTADFAFVIELL